MTTRTATHTEGPIELRIRWEPDEPYDPGDALKCDRHFDHRSRYGPADCADCAERAAEVWSYVERWGVYGCIVQVRPPACACCGRTGWETAESLWGIVGDEAYCRSIERDLMAEVAS